jgi:hypothetical protein
LPRSAAEGAARGKDGRAWSAWNVAGPTVAWSVMLQMLKLGTDEACADDHDVRSEAQAF